MGTFSNKFLIQVTKRKIFLPSTLTFSQIFESANEEKIVLPGYEQDTREGVQEETQPQTQPPKCQHKGSPTKRKKKINLSFVSSASMHHKEVDPSLKGA